MPISIHRRALQRCVIGVLTLAVSALSACGGSVGADTGDKSNPGDGLALSAFSTSQSGWNAVIPAFLASPQGAGIKIEPTFGSSGEMTQTIVDGKATADIVNLADAPSVGRLVQAQKVSADWNTGPTGGSPFGSVVTFVVRAGNPDNIHDWSDLLRPGLEVVVPNPTITGSGKWSLLAAYAAASHGNQDPAAGLAFVDSLVLEHVKAAPANGIQATNAFTQGTGDVLITSESNAIDAQRKGEKIDYITPPQTLKVDNVVAVTSGGPHVDAATKLRDYVYTAGAQRLWARAGFRPVDPTVAAEFATQFPAPQKLWTIADLGGWRQIDPRLFDSENGSITKIFNQAVQ